MGETITLPATEVTRRITIAEMYAGLIVDLAGAGDPVSPGFVASISAFSEMNERAMQLTLKIAARLNQLADQSSDGVVEITNTNPVRDNFRVRHAAPHLQSGGAIYLTAQGSNQAVSTRVSELGLVLG